jgi:hypothetical protein
MTRVAGVSLFMIGLVLGAHGLIDWPSTAAKPGASNGVTVLSRASEADVSRQPRPIVGGTVPSAMEKLKSAGLSARDGGTVDASPAIAGSARAIVGRPTLPTGFFAVTKLKAGHGSNAGAVIGQADSRSSDRVGAVKPARAPGSVTTTTGTAIGVLPVKGGATAAQPAATVPVGQQSRGYDRPAAVGLTGGLTKESGDRHRPVRPFEGSHFWGSVTASGQ